MTKNLDFESLNKEKDQTIELLKINEKDVKNHYEEEIKILNNKINELKYKLEEIKNKYDNK